MKWDETPLEIKSEINIAPLVDVVLVLLIIFMLASPFLYEKIQVNLPQSSGVVKESIQNDDLVLTIDKDKNYFLSNEKIEERSLFSLIEKRIKNKKKKILYIKADYSLFYGEIAELMSKLQEKGSLQIALITKPE